MGKFSLENLLMFRLRVMRQHATLLFGFTPSESHAHRISNVNLLVRRAAPDLHIDRSVTQ